MWIGEHWLHQHGVGNGEQKEPIHSNAAYWYALEYSCTNSTNQITHCEVSKSPSETWVSLLSPQGTVLGYCLLSTWNPWQLATVLYNCFRITTSAHNVCVLSLCVRFCWRYKQYMRARRRLSGQWRHWWGGAKLRGEAMWLLDRARKTLKRLVCQRPCHTRTQSVISSKRTSDS